MILGIDEVGDFAVNSEFFHYFIVVHLDQDDNGISIKRQQFYDWLSSISENKKNKHGEVKGKDLTDLELLQFAELVISSYPLVRINQVRIIPKENPPTLIERFKLLQIGQYKKVVCAYNERGFPKVAQTYQQLIHWYGNRNYQQYLKIMMLNETIPEAIHYSIKTSILLECLKGSFSDNLTNVTIKIDRDFINGPQPRIFWSEVLRNAFRVFTVKSPIPALSTWGPAHPFLKKYATPDGKVDFSDIFKNNCGFYHSHEHFEIQMADIVGNIVHRFQNKKRCREAYEKIVEKLSGKRHNIIHLVFNPYPDENVGVVFEDDI